MVFLITAMFVPVSSDKLQRDFGSADSIPLDMKTRCPVCGSEGNYRGGLVFWELREDSFISTSADRLPVIWCTTCGNLFTRKELRGD